MTIIVVTDLILPAVVATSHAVFYMITICFFEERRIVHRLGSNIRVVIPMKIEHSLGGRLNGYRDGVWVSDVSHFLSQIY